MGEQITCKEIDRDTLMRLPHIPSGYTTDRVYVLRRSIRPPEFVWMLVPGAAETYTKVYDRGDPREWLEPYFQEVRADKTQYLVAEQMNTTIGLLTYAETEWNHAFWLLDIRVRAESRRSGAGSLLLTTLKQRAIEAGVRGISVETQINNAPAIDFYRKHGFEISGFNDHLYENDDLVRQDVAVFLFCETA